ncbi:MAG: hypothetical protein DMF88_05140 [Acidobacteria bacterium]|nr:MAG: hypothetical protein DMF88_05140 [Acidobacteriota bacterium]
MVARTTEDGSRAGRRATCHVTITAAATSAATTRALRIVFGKRVGSTAGMTTIEFEPGAVHDLNRVFEALASRDGEYQHHLRWGDDNGSSHVRAALLSHRAVQGRRAARSMTADRALRVRRERGPIAARI